MSLRFLALGLLFLVPISQADAQLVFGNGGFEGGIPDGVHQAGVASPWYDFDGTNFFDNAWQISIDGISPNDTAVLALSANAADATLDGAGLNGYAYQSIGTAGGANSVTFSFDWGSFDDAPGPRDLGLTFSILEDTSGSALVEDLSDILGQPGVAVIDSMSTSQLDVPISGTFNEEWTFDLSSAGSGNLYLRINNYETDAANNEAWIFVDNINCDICELPGELTLDVNRDTGAVQLSNSLGELSLVQYSINSPAGTLNPANWDSIASTADADSGGGFDPDDTWTEQDSSATAISEVDPVDGGPNDGGTLGETLALGAGLWKPSYYEDLTASVLLWDGVEETTLNLQVNFTGDVQADPYQRSDLDYDNDIDADDFNMFFANHLTTLSATLAHDSYPLGDLDGDLDNDVNDFALFKADFIAANGAAAFESLFAGAVPEPSAAVLAAGLLSLAAARRRRLSRRSGLACLMMLTLVCAAPNAEAVVVSFSDTAPVSDGDDVFYFLTDPLTDADNVYDSVVGTAGGDDSGTYVAFDRQHQGQTFTTGATGGYVNAVWLQHAGYTENPGLTYYNLQAGSTFQARITDPSQAGMAGFALADEVSAPLNGLESNTISPAFASSNNGTGTWVRFAFENPITVSGNTSYGFDVTSTAVGFFETLGSSAGGYAGGEAYNGTTTAAADDILNPLVGDRAFFVEISDTPGNPVAEALVLNIDPVTGAMGITNNTGAAVTFDHYELRSEVGGLSSTGWSSLSSQGKDAVDGADAGDVAGDSVGETWTVPGGVAAGQASTNLLAEAFVLGSTSISPNRTLLLGNGYNTSIGDTALTGSLRTTGGAIIPLAVRYDGVPEDMGLQGDFNEDGVVDAADYTVWRDNLGADESVLPPGAGDGSGTVDAGDYAAWRSNYGASAAASTAATGAPEPAAVTLLLAAGAAALRRPRRA
ncbi:hypothetical protein KOR34_06120 [Posidoniimonas corsicana]|uniref:PEP-CTERM protein-sorting domain-containing protein n=1 Tax=Posidoniimonas corsicana TaxID=1938618 RepID=A0A5C5VB11_9BACT|nr:hypothetical protein [Posidoniimonas corsicana]TWT35718.1 hypothetical protein KOR34_06120 [Posidoniimonas corsicana]